MAQSQSLLQQLDWQLESILAGWSIYSTVLALALVTYLLYPVFFSPEPDTHPLLLARQAAASPVRQPGESAIFRSPETPYSYPLRTGLNVKDPGTQKWMSGRDGDLRDVWKQALQGPPGSDNSAAAAPGKVLTVLGKEQVIEYKLPQLTKYINDVGNSFKGQPGSSVAIYLPNSVEYLVALFAAVLYGFKPVLISQKFTPELLAQALSRSGASILIAAAGTVSLKDVLKFSSGLKQVIWVVEKTSRHMDWNEVPEGVGGTPEITVWHDIIEEKASTSDLPSETPGGAPPNIITIHKKSRSKKEELEIVEFTQKNIVAAVAAQISALPQQHRLGPADLVLSLESFNDVWALTLTLAALFSNSSIGITSVAGPKAKYDVALRAISPTVLFTTATTMSQAYRDIKANTSSSWQKFLRWMQSRSLSSGIMPKFSGILPSPRLVYVAESTSNDDVPLSSNEIFDLRLLTGSRIIHALTNAKVAGAIAQTNLYDYQIRGAGVSKYSHFGPPLSSVEVKFKETDNRSDANGAIGKLVVSGPAVVGEEITIDRVLTITESNTLCYA